MTDPSTQSTSSVIAEVENGISALWRLETSVSRALKCPDGLTPAAYGIMALLEPPARLCLSDLADRLGLGKPGVSRQVATLVAAGFVIRVPLSDKGCVRELKLTHRGLEVLSLDRVRRRARLRHAMSGWASTSIDDLVRLLGRLNDCYGQNLTRQYARSDHDATAAERDEGRPAD